MRRFQSLPLLLFAIVSLLACNPAKENNGDETDNQTPVVVTGVNILVSRNFNVTLDASDSVDADGDVLTYTWTQVAGPDVTGATNSLSGATPVFTAPDDVVTLIFELVVNDGKDNSEPETVVVNVLENVNAAYFVDGDNGDDGDGVSGSQTAPFATIAQAICKLTDAQEDIYVMRRLNAQFYDETYTTETDPCPGSSRDLSEILTLPSGTSLYGGYGSDWVRDVSSPSIVETIPHGFRFTPIHSPVWLSGMDISAVPSKSDNPAQSTYGVSFFDGDADVIISDNQIHSGDVQLGVDPEPGNSYGLFLAAIDASVLVENNTITAGEGGTGAQILIQYAQDAAFGDTGTAGSAATGGSGGRLTGSASGGKGGNAGTGWHDAGSDGVNGTGGAGGPGGVYRGFLKHGGNGGDGANGGIGGNGDNGVGGNGKGSVTVITDGGFIDAYFTRAHGANGLPGANGGGGGGGGGGGVGDPDVNGGGGGGGGGGGAGGGGGNGGPGGGASIGVFAASITQLQLTENTIQSSRAGDGAGGSMGQNGGNGGTGGAGAAGNGGVILHGGEGGDGGNGARGGNGGIGGAGGGGPSIGIAFDNIDAMTVMSNTISSGAAGNGGNGDDGFAGDGGHSYALFDSTPDIAEPPILSNNDLSSSSPGNGGSANNAELYGEEGLSQLKNW